MKFDFIYFIVLMGSLRTEGAPFCRAEDSLVPDETLQILEEGFPKYIKPFENELRVMRNVRLSGNIKIRDNTAALEIRMPHSQTILETINLSKGQAYRGLEILAITKEKVSLRSRNGWLIHLKVGDQNGVEVFVLAEKRDAYHDLLERAKKISFEEFQDRRDLLLKSEQRQVKKVLEDGFVITLDPDANIRSALEMITPSYELYDKRVVEKVAVISMNEKSFL